MSGTMINASLSPAAYIPDYGVFWTAARVAANQPELLYDIDAITRAQAWLTDPELGPRPWAYPPSALLLFAPFAQLPVWPSLLVWDILSLLLFLAATRHFVSGWGIALVLVSPPVVWCLLSGQTSLFAGGLVMLALAQLGVRPVAAGIALGVVAAVKPQVLLLAPLALARGGHWRTLLTAAVTGAAMVALSLIYGVSLWRDWLRALGEFGVVVDAMRLHGMGISPASFARAAGLPDAARILLEATGAALGACLVWRAFRCDDLIVRTAALIGGSILCSPYAMPYELAMLVPVAVATLLSGRLRAVPAGLVVVGAGGMVSILALLLATALEERHRTAAEPAA